MGMSKKISTTAPTKTNLDNPLISQGGRKRALVWKRRHVGIQGQLKCNLLDDISFIPNTLYLTGMKSTEIPLETQQPFHTNQLSLSALLCRRAQQFPLHFTGLRKHHKGSN